MSLVNKATLAQSPSLRARIVAAIAGVAGDVMQENPKPPPQAAKRAVLASSVLRDPEQQVGAFIWPVLYHADFDTKGEDITDAQIRLQVVAVWDIVAGVTAADKTA